MDPFALWVKGAILHRLSVVHPGGIRPEVRIMKGYEQFVASCKDCNWRSTISRVGTVDDLEFVQGFVNSTESAGILTDRFMKEFLVFSVMAS